MARLIPDEAEVNIKRSLEDEIRNRLNLSYNAFDSIASAFSETVSDELVFLRRQVQSYFEDYQITNVSGAKLDKLAFETFGLTRLSDSFSNTTTRQRNVYFYAQTGVFGDLNNNQEFMIPKGTLISTSRNPESSRIVYELDDDVVLLPEARRAFVSVTAVSSGFEYNVDANSLNYHGFTDYALGGYGGLNVTNLYPILNGRDLESDLDFKFRLNNFLTSQINLNVDSITLRSLLVPGVVDVRIVPSYNGIGTTGVILFNSGKETTVDINRLVQNRIDEMRIPGRNIIVNPGVNVIFEFEMRVYIKTGLNEVEKEDLRIQLKQQLFSLIKSYEDDRIIDFSLISNYIRTKIKATNVIGYGTNNNNNSLFEKLYIRKTDRYEEYPEERQELITTSYNLRDDERLNFGNINIILEEDLRDE